MARILHITDLHLSSPTGADEPLREGYYREYLDTLVDIIGKDAPGAVDGLIATGDFVDRGNTENFAHAKAILSHLGKALKLTEQQMAVCIGNHDLVRALDMAGKGTEARQAFTSFSLNYANGTPVHACPSGRASLCKLSSGIWCLMIDSTLGAAGGETPGKLPEPEVDEIINNLVRRVPDAELLVVGTHFPVELPPGNVCAFEEDGWHERHFWSGGITLRERIVNLRKSGTTVWLCGDIHSSDHISINQHHFIVTGRIGTRVETTAEKISHIPRQAKLVVLDGPPNTPRVLTLSFVSKTHKENTSLAKWETRWAEIRTPGLPPTAPAISATSDTVAPGELGVMVDSASTATASKLEVLSTEVQEEIVAAIRTGELYSVGRFTTSPDADSLSWISIGPLLNTPSLLPHLVRSMTVWIEKQLLYLGDHDADDVVFIGLDCWGGALATQLSISCGGRAIPVAARSRGRHHTEWERMGDRQIPIIKRAKVVVFVSDVVSRGKSLLFVYEEISKLLKETEVKEKRWLAVSVIADNRPEATSKGVVFHARATACSSIPILSFPKSQLPDETILPPRVSLV